MSAFAAAILVAALSAAEPAASPSPAASPAPSPSPALDLRTVAAILRAEDRRLVDEPLLAALGHKDPAIRARAVTAYGRIADPACRPRLTGFLKDPAPAVRAEAIFALGLLGDPSVAPALAAAAKDADPEVRSRVAEALGRVGGPEAAGPVLRLLGDASADVRRDACMAAWKLPDAGPAVEKLAELTKASDPGVRFAAAYALARLGSAPSAAPSSGAQPSKLSPALLSRARGALVRIAAATEPEIRMQVARGLTNPSTPEEVSVIAALAADADARVRVSAVRAYAFPGAPYEPVLRMGTSDKDVRVVRATVEALGRAGGDRARQVLVDGLLREKRPWIREGAIVSLAQIAPSMAPGLAVGLADAPEPMVRAAFARVAAGRSEPEVVVAAIKLLADSSPAVQAAAVPVIAAAEGPMSEHLAPAVQSSDAVVRAAVAEAVGERWPKASTDERALLWSLLTRLAKSSEDDALPDARLAIVDAAAKAGAVQEAHARIEAALGDRDWNLRRRAADHLLKLFRDDRRERVGPATSKPLEDYVRIVEWAQKPHAARVTVERTGFAPGRFVIGLDAGSAPLAAWNFAELASKGFYNGLTVHRVVPNFVVQDGDPRGDGYGGPGYSIRDEFNRTPFFAGTLGMASDGKDTAGSQWFVTLSGQPHLDGRYTAFGQVVQGLPGVLMQILPGDKIVDVSVYEGDGTEPVPAR